MKFDFDRTNHRLIVVSVRLIGPEGDISLRLALDTGATQTILPPSALIVVGYEPFRVKHRKRITTGSGVERAPEIKVSQLQALGISRQNLKVLAHSLPPDSVVNGLLGADFMFGHVLTVDYINNWVELTKP
jgi:predicted aspartyl protease